MSDGGGQKTTNQSRNDEFVRATARIAVAQICENEGFQSFQQSSLETLADIAVRYIREIGKTAHFYASLAGRTESNAFDLIHGLEDLNLTRGFSGASDIHWSLAASNTVSEIRQYISLSEDLPFAYSLPRFPVLRERKLPPTFIDIGEEPPGEHIPAWLPAFPDPITYRHSACAIEKESEYGVELVREQRKEGLSSMNMVQRPEPNYGEGAGLATDSGVAFKARRASEINPFLAPPLQFGEKEVSPVVLPSKLSEKAVVVNRALAMETFGPGVETGRSSLFESVGGKNNNYNNNNISGTRPAVRLKFRSGRKFLATSMDMISQNHEVEKIASCFEMDEEEDEEKRRAKPILTETMEISRGFAQL
ncbi:hypothetical protein Nepgr_029301 [Nepenthes gracilis]|uniref:Transcription initiation factor TFIID subunit 8 n=1 Tax=Nepenthes gracilis TaxID=150966 RepID=A0AAD3TDZ3_NEPGR|nr:hypothetical protein Nepgr_029301 [Nepenthes gracilis]